MGEENIKDKIALGIFVVSLVAIIFLIFLIARGSISGKVIATEQEKISGKTCSDSDGINYVVKGKADYCDESGCSSKEDSCSGRNVIEWYCENNNIKSEEHECEDSCDNGMCILSTKEYKYVGGSGGGGGGGSSSGAGSTSEAVSGQNYDLGELNSEQTLNLQTNDNVIINVAGSHVIRVEDISNIQAVLVIDGASFSILAGNDQQADLNGDGANDLYVKVRTINIITHQATITFRRA